MQERAARWLMMMLYCLFAVASAWVFTKFILRWTAPFIVAYVAAAGQERAVRQLVRRGWRRSAAAAVLTLGAIVLTASVMVAAAVKGAGLVSSLAERGPAILAQLGERMEALRDSAEGLLEQAPSALGGYVAQLVDTLLRELYAVPTLVWQRLPELIAHIAQTGPDTLLFIITALLGTYLFSASFPKTNAFLLAQLPLSAQRRIGALSAELRASFGGYIRAQMILMGLTFSALIAAFFAMGVKGALPLALATALVDALPVFGTGAVLLPWAAYEMLLGDAGRAAALVLLWAGTSLIRSCVQAKLLGDQIGLSPLASLAALYVGWRVWRVMGMLLFPILLAVLSQLNDRGVIKLWKSI